MVRDQATVVDVPELPEVEALAAYLRERAVGHRVERVDVAAISALKTYDPPPSALAGQEVTGAGRHGKFLDVDARDDLHLVVHLARAGWLHYRDAFPATTPLKPGKGPIALRVRLDDGSGFDLTEAGTQKKLAAYLVTDPRPVPGRRQARARTRSPPTWTTFAAADPQPARPDQGRADRPGGAGRRRQRVLRRDPARGQAVAVRDQRPAHRRRRWPRCTRRPSTVLDRRGEPVGRAEGGQRSRARSAPGLKVHARTGLPCPVCGDTVREVSFADSSLQYCPTCQTGGKPLADRRLSRLVR